VLTKNNTANAKGKLRMAQSSINGRVAPLEAAIGEAARLIGKSRLTVIAGLGADIAGARAAIGLADRIGGALDHMHATALLRDLDVMREYGMMLTTPGEARRRGDVVMLVGESLGEDGLFDVWPDLRTHPLKPPAAAEARRRIIWLGADEKARSARRDHGPGAEIEDVAAGPEMLPALIGALRARVSDRPVALSGSRLREIDALAAAMRLATFGVAVWSAARLDVLTIEMLCGLVKDLNATTRFTGLPLAPKDNAAGVLQACGWMTGFPPRTSFARGFPDHDPWMFDADRLVESGEADCAIWISAYKAPGPRWRRPVPLIALADDDVEFAQAPAVRIAIGRPGVDHDGVEYSANMATLAPARASRASAAPTVAQVIGKLVAALGGDAGSPSC
jgi:formylmethanofuran dehydrogenase subunit B